MDPAPELESMVLPDGRESPRGVHHKPGQSLRQARERKGPRLPPAICEAWAYCWKGVQLQLCFLFYMH